MDNRITVSFSDKSLIALSGNINGEALYNEQIKNKLLKNKKNIIVFPASIEMITISFTKGMYKNIVKDFGVQNLFDFVDVETGDKWLDDKIRKDVFSW